MLSPRLNELVELAYSAAVEDALWREWTAKLVDELDSPGALFWVIDAGRVEMCRNHMVFREVDNAEITAEYLAGPVVDDPQMRKVCSSRRSEIYLDTDHVDPEDGRVREYLAWQEARVGSRHHVTSSVVLSDRLKAGVSLHRRRRDGPVPREVQAQVRALFPEFARALRLGFHHAEAVQEAWWDGFAGADGDPRLLLSADGRVARFNPAAQAIFDRNDGLKIERDTLRCLDGRSDEALEDAIARACRPVHSAGRSLAVRRTGRRAPYLVSVYPLVQRRRFLAPYGAAALVCLTDPAARAAGLTEPQRAMLNLSAREGQLADLLMKGHSLESASETLGVSYNTTRNHLRALFQKTDTSRQAELILFLSRLR